MKRRSFFLMEVIIAVILISGFAFLTIQGAFRVISKQNTMIKEIEASIEADRRRMEIVETYWNKVETVLGKPQSIGNGIKISSEQTGKDKYYLLKIKEGGKTYCYFVTKHTR